MCTAPDCTATPQYISLKTRVPGTKRVDLNICPQCDSRRCQTCHAIGQHTYVQDPRIRHCPRGHTL